MFAPGTAVNCGWLKKLKASSRYSKVFDSVILNVLRMFTSKFVHTFGEKGVTSQICEHEATS